jgi:hypothetical protein
MLFIRCSNSLSLVLMFILNEVISVDAVVAGRGV